MAAESAAIALDLSLPTDEQLMSVAVPNPRAEAERLTGTGDPTSIGELGRTLTDSGAGMDGLHRTSQQAQQLLAAGFHNDGTPVYDEATHRAALPAGFRDAGSQLQAIGRRLGAVSDELGTAIGDVTRLLGQLQSELDRERRTWQAGLEAIGRGPDGLIPLEAVTGLLARRADIAAQMQESVNSCGRDVTGRIDTYNAVLNGCLQLLGEFDTIRPVPPRGRPGIVVDASGFQPVGVLQPDTPVGGPRPDVDPLTTIGHDGPSVEIYPLPPGGRLEGGVGYPVAPGGPKIDITVPAPMPETQTDRGQFPSAATPGIHVDAESGDAPSESGVVPEGDERQEIAQGILTDETGSPHGREDVKGTRIISPEQHEGIVSGLRTGLGPPDHVVDVPGKGTVEVWNLDDAGASNVTIRDFSRSGHEGRVAQETIDVNAVPGLEGVRKYHVESS